MKIYFTYIGPVFDSYKNSEHSDVVVLNNAMLAI